MSEIGPHHSLRHLALSQNSSATTPYRLSDYYSVGGASASGRISLGHGTNVGVGMGAVIYHGSAFIGYNYTAAWGNTLGTAIALNTSDLTGGYNTFFSKPEWATQRRHVIIISGFSAVTGSGDASVSSISWGGTNMNKRIDDEWEDFSSTNHLYSGLFTINENSNTSWPVINLTMGGGVNYYGDRGYMISVYTYFTTGTADSVINATVSRVSASSTSNTTSVTTTSPAMVFGILCSRNSSSAAITSDLYSYTGVQDALTSEYQCHAFKVVDGSNTTTNIGFGNRYTTTSSYWQVSGCALPYS